MTRNDYNDLSSIIQATINPLVAKLQTLETKVDVLNQDRVTKSDIEKMQISFVSRDAYEPRHAALIDRDAQIELQVRELRKDTESEIKELRDEVEKDLQRIHERLESGKQQLEDRMKQQAETQLSTRDRNWLRISQAAGLLGFIGFIFDWLFQHVIVR